MQSDPVSSRVNAFLKHVGALSLGTAGLGGVYQQVEDPARLAADTISASVMRGMTLIDTAPWYLNSEEMVGIGLKQTGIPREQVLLASKVGRYRSEINPSGDFDYSSERIVVSVASSCAKLHTNHIDVVYLHDIEFVGAVEVDAALVALEELQQTGVVGLIGICGYPLPVLDATVARNKGRIQVVQSYSHLTLQNNALLPYAERWSEMGIIVINAAPLSMGLLSNRGSPAWHPASSQLREACIAAARIPTLSLPIHDLAVQYSLKEASLSKCVVTTVIGCVGVDEVKNSTACRDAVLEDGFDLNQFNAEVDEVHRILGSQHNQTWA